MQIICPFWGKCFIKLSETRSTTHVEGLQFGLEFPLGAGNGGVLGAQFVQLFVAVGEFLLGLATTAVRLFEESAALLELVLQGVSAALRDAEEFPGLVARSLLLLERGLHVLQLLLVSLDVLLCLGVRLVRVVQRDLQLVNIRLQLLLHAQRLSFTLRIELYSKIRRVLL